MWVEEPDTVAKAVVLHSGEKSVSLWGGFAHICLHQKCCCYMNMRRVVVVEDLKVNWSARGGETAGEVEGGGGEERGELLWVA